MLVETYINHYKIVLHLFGAAYAAPNNDTAIFLHRFLHILSLVFVF